MKRFKQFIFEDENSLQLGIIEHANRDLRRLVGPAKGANTAAEVIKQVMDVLADYDIIMINDDNTKFKGHIVGGNSDQSFRIAPLSSENDRKEYIPYPKVKLNVSWGESKNVFVLKGAKIS